MTSSVESTASVPSQRPPNDDELDRYETRIDAWLVDQHETNQLVDAVERDSSAPRRWFVRLLSEEKGPFTIRFHLDQRTLRYETYFSPAPEENEAEFYRHLLVRNMKMYGAAFCVGEENAVFIRGQLGLTHAQLVSDEAVDAELDRVLGSIYVWTEQFFRAAMRIGFASRFKG